MKPLMKNNHKTHISQYKEKKLVSFHSKTFAAKLFIKMTHGYIDLAVAAISILKFEPKNRTKEDVQMVIPWLKTINKFYNMILYQENDYANQRLLLKELILILFYQYCREKFVIKRAGEKTNWFFLVIDGSVAVLEIKYNRRSISEEEYLIYLVKLKLLHENELLNQCVSYNKELFPITTNDNDLVLFIQRKGDKYYQFIREKAINELSSYGISANNYRHFIANKTDYILMTTVFENKSSRQMKFSLLIPKYEQVDTLTNEMYFGNLNLSSNHKDNRTYIADTHCDIAYINKNDYPDSKLFYYMKNKSKEILRNILNTYYLFQHVNLSNFTEVYGDLFSYRQIFKGQNIIVQDSQYNGLYLIMSGTFQFKTNRSYEDIEGLMITLKQCLSNFTEYYSQLNHKEDEIKGVGSEENLFKNRLSSISRQKKKNIKILKISNREIVGLNEYYNYKTILNEFTLECISEQAEVLFLSKDSFKTIMNKDYLIKKQCIDIVENKVNLIMEALKCYKNDFQHQMDFNIKFEQKRLEAKKQQEYMLTMSNFRLNHIKINSVAFKQKFNLNIKSLRNIVTSSTQHHSKSKTKLNSMSISDMYHLSKGEKDFNETESIMLMTKNSSIKSPRSINEKTIVLSPSSFKGKLKFKLPIVKRLVIPSKKKEIEFVNNNKIQPYMRLTSPTSPSRVDDIKDKGNHDKGKEIQKQCCTSQPKNQSKHKKMIILGYSDVSLIKKTSNHHI